MTSYLDAALSCFVEPGLLNGDLFAQENEVINDRFEYVRVKALNSNGTYINDRNATSENTPLVREFLVDYRTGYMYKPDPISHVVIKNLVLCILILPFTAAKMAYFAARVVVYFPINTALALYTTFSAAIYGSENEEVSAAYIHIKDKCFEDLYNIVRSPIYAIGMQLAAIKGTLEYLLIDAKKALEAKVIMADIESKWNYDTLESGDVRHFVHHMNIDRVQAVFLPWCFQPLDDLNFIYSNGIRKYEIISRRSRVEELHNTNTLRVLQNVFQRMF